MTVPERLVTLGTSADGLTEQEASGRLLISGTNEPVRTTPRHHVAAFLANFTHTLALLLWFAAGLAFAAGITELGAAIIAVVAVNGVFAYAQEHRAEQVVSGLMRRAAVQARVIRADQERRVPAPDLVPGDIIRLAAGDIVPADAVLLSADNLTIDLSVITGETLPVERTPELLPNVDAQAPIADLTCVLPSGSAVATGTGEAMVFATGPDSTLGQVAGLVEGVQRGQSVLEQQVAGLSRVTAVIAVLAGAMTLFLAALTNDLGFLAGLTFATGVIVALVPEGLLPTLSVSLAIGARRMAERGAAVRRLSAVEVVGSVTVICTDKTGTLSQNSLSVLGLLSADGSQRPSESIALAAVLCNDAHRLDDGFAGDPLDVALLRWASDHGVDIDRLRAQHPRLADVPFDAHRRYMSVTCLVDGAPHDLVKGAPEAVLALSSAATPTPIERALDEATARGERVVLLAAGAAGGRPAIIGLVRLHDPPRPEVPGAVAACTRAGIRVVMLTGDHPATARAVAMSIGLGDEHIPVLEGNVVDGLPDGDLLGMMRKNAVFARVTPEQKLRLVSLLRRSGEIVVVTGDGINDAPALRAADVGVAMGRRGTEVAKQAADIVLVDDNFATIVAAIEEGRSIKSNIRRFVSYVFTSNVAELAPFLLYIFFSIPLPLAVIQALGVDLGTDLLPALALGVERPSPGIMASDPEPPRRPLLTRRLALKTFLFFGIVEAMLGLMAHFVFYAEQGWRPFGSLAPYDVVYQQATAATFLGIVGGQIGCLFAQRDGPQRARLSLRGNRWLVWGLAFELALALGLVYIPGLNHMFLMDPVPAAWLLLLPGGAAAFIAVDALRRGWVTRHPVSPARPMNSR
jgi:sodium/potassium-transporting ATPase subunit alpha